jgi:phage host-nuclease inhibitor protein Gam
MNELEIKTKLDQLSNFQDHRNLLDADKRNLLEEVKVPEEVQAIVSAGMKNATEIEMSFIPEIESSIAQEKAELDAVVVPAEIKSALAEIDAKRAAIQARYRAQDAQRREMIAVQKETIRTEVESATRGVYTALAARKAEIEAEFAGKSEAVDENIKKLTEEIKAEVKTLGHSVKGDHYQGVYMNGRITWDTKAMDGYAVGHPEVLFMRKEGEPSVTLRRI